jgi:DNA-binding MarR family transcriptional regulator
MTQRDFFTNVIEANINDEMTDFAKEAIAKLDSRNEKRKSTLSKSQKANEAFKGEIITYLTGKDKYTLCSEIAEHFGVTTQKVSGVLTLMVKDGTVETTEVKVKGGKRKGYKLVTEEEEEEEEEEED